MNPLQTMFTEEQTKLFEETWVQVNKFNKRDDVKKLEDDVYINYKIWEDINWRMMFNKHCPNTIVYRGDNSNIIFHGSCLSCTSQQSHGIDRCKGCQYFKADWHNKPDLSIKLTK